MWGWAWVQFEANFEDIDFWINENLEKYNLNLIKMMNW